MAHWVKGLDLLNVSRGKESSARFVEDTMPKQYPKPKNSLVGRQEYDNSGMPLFRLTFAAQYPNVCLFQPLDIRRTTLARFPVP